MEKQSLINAARCAKEWVESLEGNKKRTQAFHGLLYKMSQRVLDSDAIELAFVLAELVDNIEQAESNTAQGKAFSNFENKLAAFSDALREFAIDNDFEFIPTVTIDKSQRNNVANFSAVSAAHENILSVKEIPHGAIRYTFDEKHQLWRIFGFLSGMRLRVWPLIFSNLIILALAVGYFMIAVVLLLVAVDKPAVLTIMGIFVGLFVGYLFVQLLRSYDRFTTTRIALAPDILASVSAPQSVMVIKLDGDNDPTVEVIAATATCPVCKGEIRLRKPHFKCPHEVIGACRNNPTEHCFTFDHVTRLGWPISVPARNHSHVGVMK